MARLHQFTRVLREQCPWDQEQNHASLVRYLVEETYEVVDALQALDASDATTDDALVEELGDLLYQIEFHATIAEQQGRFTMADVAQGVHDKLVRRHPHVFPPADGDRVIAEDAATVKANWDDIKKTEKGRTSAFDGLAHSQPSLAYAEAVQQRAAKVGFDWPNVDGALPKIAEEAAELRAAANDGDAGSHPRRARRPAVRSRQRCSPPGCGTRNRAARRHVEVSSAIRAGRGVRPRTQRRHAHRGT